MDLERTLKEKHSKETTQYVVDYVGSSTERFADLMDCVVSEDRLLVQRAAWPMSYCVENYPELLDKYFHLVPGLLRSDHHVALHRNLLRGLQFVSIPEQHEGELLELCLGFSLDTKATVAVRCFSMNLVVNIVERFPELNEEIRETFTLLAEYESPGIRSVVKKSLVRLQKKASQI